MSVQLTAADLQHVADAAEALLRPPADGSLDAWWRGVEPRVRAAFPGAGVMLSLPAGPRVRHVSESVDPVCTRRLADLAEIDPRTGLFVMHDPVVHAWESYRRAHGIAAFGERMANPIIRRLGHDYWRSTWYNEALVPGRVFDVAGLASGAAPGEMFLVLGYPRYGMARFGDHETQVLGLLLPAFRAAHHALASLGARQAALAATLDAASEALLVVGADGRELHRNAALRRALAAEPERERVGEALHAAARALRALAPPAGPRPADARLVAAGGAERAVATAAARYAVRASYGPEQVWGGAGVVVVSLAATAALPAAPAAARTLGLTAREGEVARLLAQRLTSAELAAALGISVHTVRRHTEKVMQKLGVHSRRELAAALRAAAPPEAPAVT